MNNKELFYEFAEFDSTNNKDKEIKISLYEGNDAEGETPHLHIYTNGKKGDKSSCVYVELGVPKYPSFHYKESLKPNKKLREKIFNKLKSPYKKNPKITVWEAAINSWKTQHKNVDSTKYFIYDENNKEIMPNYSNGIYSPKEWNEIKDNINNKNKSKYYFIEYTLYINNLQMYMEGKEYIKQK